VNSPKGRASPVVLDGGLATELEARGHDLPDRLWSARLLLSDPDAIEAVHVSYFAAGAEVATSASYQATTQATIFLELVNLNNEPFVTYQGIPERPIQEEFYETWGEIGVRWRM